MTTICPYCISTNIVPATNEELYDDDGDCNYCPDCETLFRVQMIAKKATLVAGYLDIYSPGDIIPVESKWRVCLDSN